jgi:hypothetical protein
VTQPISYGLNPSGYIKPLLVDNSGNLLTNPGFALSGANVLLVDAAGRAIVQGYGGNVLFGYNDRLVGAYDNLALPAGTTTYNWADVPAGSIYVLTTIYNMYLGTLTSVRMIFSLNDGITDYPFSIDAPVTSGVGLTHLLQVILKAGDHLRFVVTNATLNNDVHAAFLGYEMLVP